MFVSLGLGASSDHGTQISKEKSGVYEHKKGNYIRAAKQSIIAISSGDKDSLELVCARGLAHESDYEKAVLECRVNNEIWHLP
jgi:hypothetical protein